MTWTWDTFSSNARVIPALSARTFAQDASFTHADQMRWCVPVCSYLVSAVTMHFQCDWLTAHQKRGCLQDFCFPTIMSWRSGSANILRQFRRDNPCRMMIYNGSMESRAYVNAPLLIHCHSVSKSMRFAVVPIQVQVVVKGNWPKRIWLTYASLWSATPW